MPYRYLQAEPTIQVIGEIVRDAQRITIQALPSGTAISSVFGPWPSDIWTPAAIDGALNETANLVAGWLATPGVSGVAQTQEIDDLNQLHDMYLVAVRSASGNSRATVTLSEPQMNPQTFPATVAVYVDQLNAQEAAGAQALAPIGGGGSSSGGPPDTGGA